MASRARGRWLDDVGNTQLQDAPVLRGREDIGPLGRAGGAAAFRNREAAKAYVEPRVADEEELARQLGRDIEAWDPQRRSACLIGANPAEKRPAAAVRLGAELGAVDGRRGAGSV